MIAPALHLKNISLSYRQPSTRKNFTQQILLENFNAILPGGKWSCILGPSGIGKSSLLHLIANLISKDEQTIKVLGSIEASDQLPLLNRIAYMAQTDLLLPWLNVIENALLGKKLRGNITSDDKDKAHGLLTKIGLANALYKFPWQLSGGMRQRVALARTLLEDKPIVLMDEPFSALDAITRLKLQALAVELLADRTVVMVTHDPLEALRIGQRIFVMTGVPAHLDTWFELATPTPRAMHEPDIIQLEAQLFHQLMQAQEML